MENIEVDIQNGVRARGSKRVRLFGGVVVSCDKVLSVWWLLG